MSQVITTSRFEAFVNCRFHEVETLADTALPKYVFDEYVAKSDRPREAVPPTHAHMNTTGEKRSEAEADTDGPSKAAKSQ